MTSSRYTHNMEHIIYTTKACYVCVCVSVHFYVCTKICMLVYQFMCVDARDWFRPSSRLIRTFGDLSVTDRLDWMRWGERYYVI